jgi:hypothetical protein
MTTVEHDIDEAGVLVESDKKRVLLKVAPKFIQVNGATGIPLMPASPAPGETNAHTHEMSSFLMQQRKSTLGNAAVVAAMCSDNIFRDWNNFNEIVSNNFPELVNATWVQSGVATKQDAIDRLVRNCQDIYHIRNRMDRVIPRGHPDGNAAKSAWKSHIGRVLTANKPTVLQDSDPSLKRPEPGHWLWVRDIIGEDHFLEVSGGGQDNFWDSDDFQEKHMLLVLHDCKDTSVEKDLPPCWFAYFALMFSHLAALESLDWSLVSDEVPPYPILQRLSCKLGDQDIQLLPREQFQDVNEIATEAQRWASYFSKVRANAPLDTEQDMLNSLSILDDYNDSPPLLDSEALGLEDNRDMNWLALSSHARVENAVQNFSKGRNLQGVVSSTHCLFDGSTMVAL